MWKFSNFFGFFPIITILGVWELVTRLGMVNTFFLPSVSTISQRTLSLFLDGTLPWNGAVSTWRALSGLMVAIVVGTPLGLAMARKEYVRWGFDALVSIGNPAPKISFLPIFILWFGIGDLSKILMVAVSCVFPIVISTYTGAMGVSRYHVWSALAMGTSERNVFRKIVLPATLPFIFAGVQVALPLSLIVVFVTEMVSGGGGLGSMLIFASRFLEIPTEFSALFAVLLLGFVSDRLVLAARTKMLNWHEGELVV